MGKLKSSYDHVEEIPEGSVKDFFVKSDDDRYTLDGEGFVTADTYAAIEKQLQKQKQLTRQIEKQRDEALSRIPDGFDDDKWQSFLTWQETHKDGEPDAKVTLEIREEKIREIRLAAEEKARKENQAVLKERDERLRLVETALQEEVKTNALEKALHNARIAPKHFEVVRAFHEKKIKTIEDEDVENGRKRFRAIVEVDGIERDVGKWIEEWSSSDSGKEYVDPIRTLGGGQNGDGTRRLNGPRVNPFVRDTWNLTAQAQLKKTNPKLYDDLRREAGI